MMHNFLADNRAELIARCIHKVGLRPRRNATERQLQNGVPMFLEQLTRTLEAEQAGDAANGLDISGPSGGDAQRLSEIGVSAAAHGKALLGLGYTVDQVVHDYGDLCQAITDLAFERDAPFSVAEFRTLNRCLDNAIADAVTEFGVQRDEVMAEQQSNDLSKRVGFLMHELRNSLNAATLAASAMDAGNLPMAGATGAVLKRSHLAMEKLIDRSLAEVRIKPGPATHAQAFSLADFITEASDAARLSATKRKCIFTVTEVDRALELEADRDALLGALANLLTNAFKFTQTCTEVVLRAYAEGDRILIEVSDHCGGLPSANVENLFTAFTQVGTDRSGLGLGLSIARRSVTADGGNLNVTNLPGTGCTFTIDMPRRRVDGEQLNCG